MTGLVVAVARSTTHAFSKQACPRVQLIEGFGVLGDAHAGPTVRHRSRMRRDPTLPNLRQVHLLHAELLDELEVEPAALGENVTTRGVDLLGLSTGSVLHLGESAVVELTGLRNPCVQIEHYRKGLLKRVVQHDDEGQTRYLAGVMAVVLVGGVVQPGDAVDVVQPEAFVPLQRV